MAMDTRVILILTSSLGLSPLAILSVSAQTPKLTDQSKVVTNGIGSVQVGMTVAQASKAAGLQLVSEGSYPNGSSCFYVKPKGGPSSVAFMVSENRIARVDVSESSAITTLSGARIGDTESRIKSLYPGQIEVTPHKYTNGHYLTFIPRDRGDRNYRVVFETDGQRVTGFRAGKLPEVQYVEGCS